MRIASSPLRAIAECRRGYPEAVNGGHRHGEELAAYVAAPQGGLAWGPAAAAGP
jgi:hypothetical protein